MNRASAAPSHYAITDLGLLSGYASADVTALNEKGQVLGRLHTEEKNDNHTFLWQDGAMHDLGAYGMAAINNKGEAVGTRHNIVASTPHYDAVILRNGEVRLLFAGVETVSVANAINDDGLVAGHVGTAPHLIRRPQDAKRVAALWEDGALRELAPPPGHLLSAAVALNAGGVAVGAAARIQPPARLMDQAVLWRHGTAVPLGTLPGFDESEAIAVNEQEMVLCLARTREVTATFGLVEIRSAPFLWHEGQVRRLDLWSAADLNDHSQVVGWKRKPSGYVSAALWQDGVAIDLNRQIPRNLSWRLTHARAINNHGWIAGSGTHHGEPRAFLLTPREDA